jgi:hypothetical protein
MRTVAALATAGACAGVVGLTAYGLAPGACPAGAQPFSRLELVFGLSRRSGGEVSDQDWRAFADGEIAPRFPDGFTVMTGDGRWRGADGTIVHEPSRVLMVWYRPQSDSDAKIEAIRQAWKQRFDQESVLRADATDCVRF